MPSTFAGFQNAAAPKVDPYSTSTPYGAKPMGLDAYAVKPPANPGNYANMQPSQRPPAFQQTMQTQWGQMDPGQYYQQRDAFAQAALNQHGQAAQNAGVYGAQDAPKAGPPSYDPAQLWNTAGGMVQSGWQAPSFQPPPDPYQQGVDGGYFMPGMAQPIPPPSTGAPPRQPSPPQAAWEPAPGQDYAQGIRDLMMPEVPMPGRSDSQTGMTPAQETRMQLANERRQEAETRRENMRRQSEYEARSQTTLRPGQFRDPQSGRVFKKSDVVSGGWMTPRQLTAWQAHQRATSPYYWDDTTRQMISNPYMRR